MNQHTNPSRGPASVAAVRPVVATIAAVIRDDEVLLVRRANPPDAGRWGFPGGKIETGETIQQTALRELVEETGVRAHAREVFTAVDVLDYDNAGSLRQHFVLVAVRCEWKAGEPQPGDDALEARWFSLDQIDQSKLALSPDVPEVVKTASELAS